MLDGGALFYFIGADLALARFNDVAEVLVFPNCE